MSNTSMSNENTRDALQSLLLLKKVEFNSGNNGMVDADVTVIPDRNEEYDDGTRSRKSSITSTSSIFSSNLHEISRNDDKEENSNIVYPNDKDILSGRGTGVNIHPGNVFFRELVQAHKDSYVNAGAPEKKIIIQKVVDLVKASGHRYVKQDVRSQLWTTLSLHEAKRKTAQALRENNAKTSLKKPERQLQGKEKDSLEACEVQGERVPLKRKLDDMSESSRSPIKHMKPLDAVDKEDELNKKLDDKEEFNRSPTNILTPLDAAVKGDELKRKLDDTAECSRSPGSKLLKPFHSVDEEFELSPSSILHVINPDVQMNSLQLNNSHMVADILSISKRFEAVREKQNLIKQMENEIMKEQREIMQDLQHLTLREMSLKLAQYSKADALISTDKSYMFDIMKRR